MKRIILLIAAALSLAACTPKTVLTKSGLDPVKFEGVYNDKPIALYTLSNESGMEVCITNFGGRLVSIMVPDKDGEMKDVILGFDNIESYYPENNHSDFGAAIGRYANRINQGRITVDGTEYQLPQNNYGHCLHGGPQGWQYKVYDVVEADSEHIKLKMDSPDGDANFPGHVIAYVTYTLTDTNSICINYEATTDKETVINMTNHAYFNLSGDPAGHSICDDMLYINASQYTPVDSTFMTTGEIVPVAGTPMDFTTAKRVGEQIDEYDFIQLKNGNGYDHNWVLDTCGELTETAATLYCPQTGIQLDVFTTEPGIQVYSGNFLDGTNTGKKGINYQQRTAICLETQKYPDTPNKPEWPSAQLLPGDTYTSFCEFRFSVR